MTDAATSLSSPSGRPCLGPLLSLPPAARVDAVRERLGELGRACAALEAERRQLREQRRERERALRAHRYQMACLALHLEAEGLLPRAQFLTAEGLLAAWAQAEGQ